MEGKKVLCLVEVKASKGLLGTYDKDDLTEVNTNHRNSSLRIPGRGDQKKPVEATEAVRALA